LYTTIEMLDQIYGYIDTQDVILLGDGFQRTYCLACYEHDIWGCDPDGNKIEMSIDDFKQDYKNCQWIVERTNDNDSLELTTEGGVIKAVIEGDEDYPCITVKINDILLGVFEWDKISKSFRYRIYSEDQNEEEPICKREIKREFKREIKWYNTTSN